MFDEQERTLWSRLDRVDDDQGVRTDDWRALSMAYRTKVDGRQRGRKEEK